MTTGDVNMNGGQTEADDENRQSSVVILTSGFINGTVNGTAVGVDDGQTVRVTINGRTVEGTVSNGTWSVTIPDAQTLNGFSGEIIATVFDLAGNAGPTASRMVTVDTVAPTVTAVSIDENRNLKVGDEVTAKIKVSGATGETLRLISGTIGGFELGNLTKIDETTYVAKFVVTDGGTDVAQGTDLAVSLRLSDAAGNVSNNYTEATNLGLNLIANGSFEDNFNNWSSNRGAVQTDRVSEGSKGARVGAWVGGSFHAGSVQQSNVVVEADQTYVLSFDLGRYTYAGSSATLEVKILGQDGHQIGGFSRVTTGGHAMHNQSFSFDSNDYSGPVTVRFHSSGRDHFIDNVQLRNTAGTIDANRPIVTAVSIPNTAMGVRDVVTAQIKVSGAEGETLTLMSGSIGGFALSNLTKIDYATYTATFTITEGATAFAAGVDIPVSLQLSDPAGNVSNHYTRAISQDEDSIRTTRGPNIMVNGSFERGLDGWRKAGDGFVHSTHHSSDGQHSYALNKGGNKGGGTLSQDITVTSGQKYELSFSFARYDRDGRKSATFVAEIIDTTTGKRLDSEFRHTSNDMFNKSHRSFTFTAPSEKITVRFKTEGANSHLDFAIDNVQLRDVGGLVLHPVALTKAGELGDLSGRSNEFFKGDKVQIITGDFNSDGNDDFITLGIPEDSFVFLNNGNGGFARAGALTHLSSVIGWSINSAKTNIIVGDFNGDGVDDFIRQYTGEWGWDVPQVFINDGAARFTFSAKILNGDKNFFTFTSAFHGANVNMIVGDFNGDGFDDFIRQEKGSLDNDSSNTANLFINNQNGGFVRTGELGALSGLSDNEQFKGDFTNIIVGDFNGDGYDDFIRQEKGDWSLSNDDTTARLFLNNANGAGTFRMAGELSTLAGLAGDPFKGHLTTLIVDDFNGDGFDDFAVQNANSTLDLYLSNGSNFKKYSDFRTGSLSVDRGFTNLVTGDWNGDGAADLIRQEKGAWDDDSTNTANVFLSFDAPGGVDTPTLVSTAKMIAYQDAVRAHVLVASMDESEFDRAAMVDLLDQLTEHYAESNAASLLTLGDAHNDLLAMLQTRMQAQVTSSLELVEGNTIELASWKHRTVNVVEEFNKAMNNSAYLFDGLTRNWATLGTGQWTWGGQELLSNALPGKKHVDLFRKEMLYTLESMENVRKLGQMVNSATSGPDPTFSAIEIAQLSALTLEVIARATQVGLIAAQQRLSKTVNADLTASMTARDGEVNLLIRQFQNDVSMAGHHRLSEMWNVRNNRDEFTSRIAALEPELNDLYAKNLAINAVLRELDPYLRFMKDTESAESITVDDVVIAQRKINELGQELRNLGQDPETIKILWEICEQENLIFRGGMGLTPTTPDQVQRAQAEIARLEQRLRDEGLDPAMRISDYQREQDAAATALRHVMDYESKFRQIETNNARLELGHHALGTVSFAIGLGTSIASGADESYIASDGIGLAADVMGAIGTLKQATGGKASNLGVGLGAASSVLMLGPSIISYQRARDLVDEAPAGYKGYYIGEAVVQGANVALGAILGGLTIRAAVAGSKLSGVVPGLGLLASVASVVQPLQWAAFDQQRSRINSVNDRADEKSEAYETSAKLLGNLLGKMHQHEAVFYGVSSAVSLAGGIASTAATATGYGAPAALAIALVTAAASAVLDVAKQAALDDAVAKMKKNLKNWNDGVKSGVNGFIDQSFEHQADQALQNYLSQASSLIESGEFGSVTALGSVQMTETDLEIVARTGVGGELVQTQKHFAGYLDEDNLGTGQWAQNRVSLQPEHATMTLGESRVGHDNFLTFITPFDVGGREVTAEQTGKNVHRTTLVIENISGWTVNDNGRQNTTFDLSNVVTKARGKADGPLQDLPMIVYGGAGDDMFLMTDVSGRTSRSGEVVNINGGSGKDSVSYANLKHLVGGLAVSVSERGNLLVTKNISPDAETYQGTISEANAQNGKKANTLEYRTVIKEDLGTVTTLYDELAQVEMLAGSKRDDIFDVVGYNNAILVHGLDGNDTFRLKQGQAAIGGGGNDIFIATGDVTTVGQTGNDLPKRLEIAGGTGHDKLKFAGQWATQSMQLGALYTISRDVLRNDDDLRESLMPAALASEAVEDIAVATVANTLSANGWAMTSFLSIDSIEEVVWNLGDVYSLLTSASASALPERIDLTEYDLAGREFLSRSTVGDYTGLITFDASGVSHTRQILTINGNDKSNGIIGTSGNDILEGRDGDDVLEGLAGKNILTGGAGADLFRFNFHRHRSEDRVTLIDDLADEHKIEFRDQTFKDRFFFNDSGIRDVRFDREGPNGGAHLKITYTGGATNLVTNGSFEDIRNGTGPDTIPYGWYLTRGTGGIYYAPNSARVSNGDFAYVLDGWSDTPGGLDDHAVLKQDVNVKAGVQYRLSWDLGTTFKNIDQSAWFRGVVYDSNSNARLTDYLGHFTGAGGSAMTGHFKTFTATSDKVRLEFFAEPYMGTYSGDFDLDNVRLVPVVEETPSNVTIENFFTEAYAGYTETDAQQSFTFASNGHEEVLSYKQLRRAATELDRAKLVKVGELNLLANEGDADHFIGQNTRESLKANKLVVGDFNGDGRHDFIRHVEGTWTGGASQKALVYFSKPDGTSRFDRSQDLGDLSGVSNLMFTESQNTIIVGDFNGDGYDDFIKQNASAAHAGVFMNRGEAGTATRRFDNVGPLHDTHYGTFAEDSLFSGNAKIIVGDFNGDGRDDFIRHQLGGWGQGADIFFSHSYGRFVKGGDLRDLSGRPGPANEFKAELTNIIVGDFNGDGYDDFIRQEKGSFDDDDMNTANVFINTADGSGRFRKAGELYELANVSAASFKGDLSKLTVGDFNGDGFDDVMVQTSANVPDLYLSNGLKFRHSNSYYQKPAGQHDIDGVLSDTNFYAGDWNGDGVVDLIRQEKGGWANSPGNTANVYSFSKDHSSPTFRDTTGNTNLIDNGSFEDKEFGNASTSKALHWHKQTGFSGINENASADRKSDGRNSYALGGWSGQAVVHAVEQPVDGLTIGAKYQLSFDYGVWGNTNKNTELLVQILGPSNPWLEHEKWVIYNSKGTSGMTARAFEFTAKSTNIIVKFSDMGGYGAVTTDLDLDNVQLRAINPEPDPNHILNGSFEGGYTGPRFSSTPNEWDRTGIGYVSYSADVPYIYTFNSGKGGTLSQTIGTLTKGQKYELSFDFAVPFNSSTEGGVLGVTIFDETSGRIYDTFTVLTKGSAAFSTKSFSFIAPSDKITVTFEDCGVYTDFLDLAIDNVRLVEAKQAFSVAIGDRQMSYIDVEKHTLSQFAQVGDLSGRANNQFQRSNTNILVGDFNGDGYDDFIRQVKGNINASQSSELFVNQQNGTFEAKSLQTLTGLTDGQTRGNENRIIVGDFNGDGRDDFIRMEKGWWSAASNQKNTNNLIKNASFEEAYTGALSDSTPTHWNKTGAGGVHMENLRVTAGTRGYALGGYSTDGKDGTLSQVVTGLTPGKTYALSFDLGVYVNTENSNAAIEVAIIHNDSEVTTNTFRVDTTGETKMQQSTFSFDALSSNVTVKFTDLGVHSGNVDLDIDNVRLSKIPYLDLAEVYVGNQDGRFMKSGDLGPLSGLPLADGNNPFKEEFTNIIVGDFNGDGYDDYIRQERSNRDNDDSGTAQVFLNHGKGAAALGFKKVGELGVLANFNSFDAFKGDFTNIIVGDFNGDGHDDFIRQEKSAWDDDASDTAVLFLNTADGTGSFEKFKDLKNLTGQSGDPFKGDNTTLIFDDFNGDGYDDLLVQTAALQAELYWSNGVIFERDEHYGTFGSVGAMRGATDFYAGDWDSDGGADLIRHHDGFTDLYLFG